MNIQNNFTVSGKIVKLEKENESRVIVSILHEKLFNELNCVFDVLLFNMPQYNNLKEGMEVVISGINVYKLNDCWKFRLNPDYGNICLQFTPFDKGVVKAQEFWNKEV